MSAPVQNPPTPHLQPIPGGFSPGCIAHVTGTFTPGAASLIVKLQSGTNGEPSDDIGLCIYGRVREGQMGRNCFTRGVGWGTEELSMSVPGLAPGAPFNLTVMCDSQHFKMAFNGQHLCEYNHRVNPASLMYLQVASLPGDLTLSCVWIEQSVAPPQQQTQSYGAPPPSYAASAPYNPNPVAGYAPPPGMQQPSMMYPQQQQFGQPQYGQQQPPQHYQQQYSPHHQGHGKEKGLMGMVSGAAGALGATSLLNKATKVIGGGGSHHHGGGGAYPGGAYPGSGGAYPGSGGAYPQGGYGSGYPQGGGGGGRSGGGSNLLGKAAMFAPAALAVAGPGKAMKYGAPLAAASMLSHKSGGGGGGTNKLLKYGAPLAAGYLVTKGVKKGFGGFGGGFGSGSGSDCEWDSD